MTDAGHPSRHGFKRCVRCGCWRRGDTIAPHHWADGTPSGEWACVEPSVCSRLAGVGDGRIDAVGYDANGSETP